MNNLDTSHNIIIEAREKISITGVLSVEEFDENSINCTTNKGDICVKGDNLHIEKLDLENGELVVSGTIYNLDYTDTNQRGGFFARLFK